MTIRIEFEFWHEHMLSTLNQVYMVTDVVNNGEVHLYHYYHEVTPDPYTIIASAALQRASGGQPPHGDQPTLSHWMA